MANLKRERSNGAFTHCREGVDTCDVESNKRRRLTSKQVEFLEECFVLENTLNPARKDELAKHLNLHPKQVKIWFQNKRATYRTKQLINEYGSLKDNYDSLKYDYYSIIMQKEKLQNEVAFLRMKLVQLQNNSNPNNKVQGILAKKSYEHVQTKGQEALLMPSNKQAEAASSAKSDVFTSTVNVIEPPSALVFGPEPDELLDLSPEDEEYFMMSRNLLDPRTPPTLLNNIFKLSNGGNYEPRYNQPFWSSPYY